METPIAYRSKPVTQHPSRWLSSIWFLWPTLTLIYLAGYTLMFIGHESTLEGQSTLFARRILGMVGLFVPFGFWNTLYTVGALWSTDPDISPARILLWPLAITAMWIVNRAMKRSGLASPARFCVNLLVLLTLTAAVDIVLYHQWRSFVIFATGDLVAGTRF